MEVIRITKLNIVKINKIEQILIDKIKIKINQIYTEMPKKIGMKALQEKEKKI